jgi:hypothetical protein
MVSSDFTTEAQRAQRKTGNGMRNGNLELPPTYTIRQVED